MADVLVLKSVDDVAKEAAKIAARQLAKAQTAGKPATWILAGGSSPTAAYAQFLADKTSSVATENLALLIGDERCVPLDHHDSNWFNINRGFIAHLSPQPSRLLIPSTSLSSEDAATDYEQQIVQLFDETGRKRFDHAWLGVGEDGHTLSLFPGHLLESGRLVSAVHKSPKPPADRISLTLKSMGLTDSAVVFFTGQSKAEAFQRFMRGDNEMPIRQVIDAIEKGGGSVTVLVDPAAAA